MWMWEGCCFYSQVPFGRIFVGFLWGFGPLQSRGNGGFNQCGEFGKLMEKNPHFLIGENAKKRKSKIEIENIWLQCITFCKKLLVWQPAILLCFSDSHNCLATLSKHWRKIQMMSPWQIFGHMVQEPGVDLYVLCKRKAMSQVRRWNRSCSRKRNQT